MAGYLPTFFSPTGIPITRDSWVEHKKQTPDPYLIKEFENDRISMQLRRADKMQGARDIPKNFWKMYEVAIFNIVTKDFDGDGVETRRVRDLDSKEFVHQEDADKMYSNFLSKYTESHFDEATGELVEVGNVLTPPIPVSPDIPTFSESSVMAEEFGTW